MAESAPQDKPSEIPVDPKPASSPPSSSESPSSPKPKDDAKKKRSSTPGKPKKKFRQARQWKIQNYAQRWTDRRLCISLDHRLCDSFFDHTSIASEKTSSTKD